MQTKRKCRKCHECKDNAHHWIPNIYFGLKEGAGEWVCKHCSVQGDECEQCNGLGRIDAASDRWSYRCQACNEDGVIERKTA